MGSEAAVNLIINIGIPVGLIVLAMITGSALEARHFASIRKREEGFKALPAITVKDYDREKPVAEARMVYGSVVVSIDYFKKFLASLRNIVGGRVRSYESLVDRGRREAILRMKEQFPGADIIVNFRIETSSISKGSMSQKSMGSVEVLAYGTAIRYGAGQR